MTGRDQLLDGGREPFADAGAARPGWNAVANPSTKGPTPLGIVSLRIAPNSLDCASAGNAAAAASCAASPAKPSPLAMTAATKSGIVAAKAAAALSPPAKSWRNSGKRRSNSAMPRTGEKMLDASNSHAATQEYAYVGAVQGIITYADGSTLNLFDEFGVTPPDDVYFDLENVSPVAGKLRAQCAAIARTIAAELSAVPFNGLYAICGDNFYDDLIKHSEVRATYLSWAGAQDLRAPTVSSPVAAGSFGVFPFGGIMWDNYFGAVGDTTFVDPDEAAVFPMGVPGLFREYYAPADYIETVNTLGQRLYTKQYPMPNDKGVHLDTQMNALAMCTRPGTLVRVHKGPSP